MILDDAASAYRTARTPEEQSIAREAYLDALLKQRRSI
jgi:hypothetical protein